MKRNMIHLSIPNMEGNEEKYVVDAVRSTFVSTVGAYTKKFESSLSDYLCVPDIAVCQSGTSAIHLSLLQAGVVSGDVVLVPPLTFIAAVNPVRYQSATPVFIDCDDSLCMDPVKLEKFCVNECIFTDGKLLYNNARVKAVIVVHVFGNMADMVNIMKIAEKYNLKVIEDATEALGTKYNCGGFKDKFAGTIGDFGCYSFNGNKIITTGGGGAVTAKRAEDVAHIRYLSTQAKDDPHYYVHNEVGYNYRMTNLQAALGVAQMEELPMFIERKNRNYLSYKEKFNGFGLAELLPFRKGIYSNMWFYSLKLDRHRIKASLRDIISELLSIGIETRAIWGLINEQRPYRGFESYQLEKALFYADKVINIPSSTNITEPEIEYVADEIMNLLNKISK